MWIENYNSEHKNSELQNPEQVNVNSKIDAIDTLTMPEKNDLTQEATEKLNNLETQLTWATLKDIWVSRSKAFETAKDFFHVTDPLNLDNFKYLIEEFQRKNWLEVDWKIWKITFMEMHVQTLIPLVDTAIKTHEALKQIDNDTLDSIDFANSYPFASSKSKIVLSHKLAEYQKISWWKDENFNSRVESSMNKWNKALNNDPQTQKLLNTKWDNGKTFYEDIRDKWPKEAFANHSWELKLVWLVAFIFWAFNKIPEFENIPGMSSWYWRLAWIFWWAYLWWDKLIWDLLTKWSELVWKWYEWVKQWVNEWKNKFETPEWVSNLSNKLWDNSWDITKKISESYDSIVSNFSVENSKNKNTDKYIKDFDLVSETVNNDTKFTEIKISDLESTKYNADWIKKLLSNSTELFPLNQQPEEKIQREKDLVNYVKYHLLNNREVWDVNVKDLLYNKSIIDGLMENYLNTNKWFTQNETADKLIKEKLVDITDKDVKNDLLQIMTNPVNIETWNDINTKIKLEEYLDKNKSLSTNIKWILDIYESEIIYYDSLSKIDDIKLANQNVELDTMVSIDRKVKELEKIKYDFDTNNKRLLGSDNSWLLSAYNSKKLELCEQWAKLEWNNWWKYTDLLWDLRKEAELSKDEETIKTLEKLLENVPNEKSKPQDFAKFYDENEDNFKKVDILLEKYLSSETELENKISESLNVITVKYNNVNTNYEKVKVEYKRKTDDIKSKIDQIVLTWNIDSLTLENHKKTLQWLLVEFETIRWDLIKSYNLIQEIDILWRKYVNKEITIPSSDNIFENIDKKIWSTTERPLLEIIIANIHTKVIELDSKFEIKIDIANLDINNTTEVSKVVNEIVDSKKVIDTMDSVIKDAKLKELKNIVSELVKKYEVALGKENDLTKLAKIKSEYDSLVYDKLSWLIDKKDTIENIYMDKLETIKRIEFMNHVVSDEVVKEILNKSKIVEFFQKYPNNNQLKDINNMMWDNTSLSKILEVFKSIANSKTGYSKEIISKAQVIYDDLNHYIDIEVKSYVKT